MEEKIEILTKKKENIINKINQGNKELDKIISSISKIKEEKLKKQINRLIGKFVTRPYYNEIIYYYIIDSKDIIYFNVVKIEGNTICISETDKEWLSYAYKIISKEEFMKKFNEVNNRILNKIIN